MVGSGTLDAPQMQGQALPAKAAPNRGAFRGGLGEATLQNTAKAQPSGCAFVIY